MKIHNIKAYLHHQHSYLPKKPRLSDLNKGWYFMIDLINSNRFKIQNNITKDVRNTIFITIIKIMFCIIMVTH